MCRQGMGDIINISGAAVYLSRHYQKLNFPCHEIYSTSVRAMFVFNTNIHVFVLQYRDDLGLFPIIPYELGEILSTNGAVTGVIAVPDLSIWEKEYASLGVPYAERWDSCPIQEACKKIEQIPVPDEPYAFVHDDYSRDINIQEKYITKGILIVRPDSSSPNILSYCALITHATEGHYCDSCFRHLAESIETRGRLYYHEYAKHWSPDTMGEPGCPSRKKWVTLRS